MDERKKRVLDAIIKDYVANAEPVGSRTITRKYDLGVSPATIRNEMSDLEAEGYIEQPHTSAGRIPSGKGYRYYVDHLMERQRLSPSQLRQIKEAMAGELSDMETFMRNCCGMISRLTNYPVLAAVPEQGKGRVESLQLVPVNDRQALLILLTSGGLLRHKLLELPPGLGQTELAALERQLAALLTDRDLSQINYERLQELIGEFQLSGHIDQTVELLTAALAHESGHRIYTNGAGRLLSQPEFRDVEKLQKIFSVLEQDEKIKRLLGAAAQRDAGAITVTIGGEMPADGVKDCSMVVANYFVNGEKAGSIGVLGPTRMSYGKTVSLMEQIAAELGRTMSDQDTEHKTNKTQR